MNSSHAYLILIIVVETPDAPVEDAPMNVEANESTPIEGAEAGTAEDEDQFYAPPPDHVTGEVNDLAKLTNLNANTLLQEIKVRSMPKLPFAH